MKRHDYIGGSDAKRILDGEWLDLYLEKVGEKEPENLDHVFPVQLGIHTEQFHLNWLMKYEGFDIGRRNEAFRMKDRPHIRAAIDGWCSNMLTFVEAKHSNGRATQGQMVEWYQPQIAHYCNVLERPFGILSFIAGNTKPEWFKMEPSSAYRSALLEMEEAFWWHIENRNPPQIIPQSVVEAARAAREEAGSVRIDDMRVVDMTLNNEWATLAVDYQLNQAPAAQFEAAKKGLKKLVLPDVRQASGHGVMIKRSKSGSLLFSED